MPVTRSRTYFDIGLEDSNNTTGFLFGDEDSNTETKTTPTAPVGSGDVFSFLSRPTGFASMVSALASGVLYHSGVCAQRKATLQRVWGMAQCSV